MPFPNLRSSKSTVLCLVAVAVIGAEWLSGKLYHSSHIDVVRRSLQLGVGVPNASQEPAEPSCEVPAPVDRQVPATFVASYPGSGAKLTWKLIRAITGLYTGDDHDHNGRVAKGTAVAIKTHYPSHSPGEIFHTDRLRDINQAILLIRSPIHAIPSYHNFVYEQRNHLINHSTRAPVDAWIEWRNENFDAEVKLWVDHVRWWANNYYMGGNKRLHLLVFENLTSTNRGSLELWKLFDLFRNVHSSIRDYMVPLQNIDCIWELLVDGKVPGERKRRNSLRSGGVTEYPFTSFQLGVMSESLLKLRTDYAPVFPALGDALDLYLAEIQQTKDSMQTLLAQR